MKIKRLRIEHFRGFRDETINLNRYSCFVGPNGAGKSTVLCALNVFFKEQRSSATDTSKLCSEDYYAGNTEVPIRITVTFDDLSNEAKQEFAGYVRQNELVVTAEACFDRDVGLGEVRHYGQRLGMEAFRPFFEAMKTNALATELSSIYDELCDRFPELPPAKTKDQKAAALRAYESDHPDELVLIPSDDNFYGINSTGKLARFIQWVYVPAVKDAEEEGQEAKNTAFSKLIARAVHSRTSFNAELEELKQDTLTKYQQLLEKNQAGLQEVSESLQRRLASWAHPNVRIGLQWLSDTNKSVIVQQPVAGIKAGEGAFLGSLSRVGHGLQRSYLLALLHELSASDSQNAPTLILGCEEPELYQHPPQARHLSDVLVELSQGNSQVLVTTHSPYFICGDGVENVRLVRAATQSQSATVASLTFDDLCARIRRAQNKSTTPKRSGIVAKIHQALRPHVAEMFLTRIPILVEGLEDASYITTELCLSKQWPEFRRLGCHIIPVNGKDKLIEPVAIAQELKIPAFVVFDADGDTELTNYRIMHEKDNKTLLKLLGIDEAPFPTRNLIGRNHAIWQTNLTHLVKNDFGEHYEKFQEAARVQYAHEKGLAKSDLFIAEWLTAAREQGYSSPTLSSLCAAILEFANRQFG